MNGATGALADLGSFVLTGRPTLGQALACMRQNGYGIAVVTTEDSRIVGTVSDSDIRRAILAGRTLDDPVSGVMSDQPVVAPRGARDDEIRHLLSAHRVRAVPVVDDGKLIAVRSLDDHPPGQEGPMAVIMAGGRGQRLRPFTDQVPKPLLRVGSTSIIERIVAALARAGVTEIFVAVNYKAEVFEQRLGSGEHLGVSLRYLREDTAMGTAGALTLLPPGHRGPILVSNGDIVTTVEFARLFDFHWRHRGAVTVTAVEHVSPIPYGVLRTAEHHLLSIEEKPERRDLCSGGIYVLEPDVLDLLPTKLPVDMPDLIAAVLAQGLPVQVFPILEKWFDIGGTAEFERMLVQFSIGEDE